MYNQPARLWGKQNPLEAKLLEAVHAQMSLFINTNAPIIGDVLSNNPSAVIVTKIYYDPHDNMLCARVGYEPQDTRIDGVV